MANSIGPKSGSDYEGSQKYNQTRGFGKIGSTHGMIIDADQDFPSIEDGLSDTQK